MTEKALVSGVWMNGKPTYHLSLCQRCTVSAWVYSQQNSQVVYAAIYKARLGRCDGPDCRRLRRLNHVEMFSAIKPKEDSEDGPDGDDVINEAFPHRSEVDWS